MRPHRPPRALVVTAVAVLAVGLLVLLWPVLTNPIVADDRYWYLDVAGRMGGSYPGIVAYHVQELERTATGFGRVTVLAYIARALSMLLVLDLAVWSATPLVVGQALLKGALLVLILATFVGFLRVLRHRRADGSLARLSWRAVGVAVTVTAVLTGAGAQAHRQSRNGWTSYAVLTWGAVLVMIGTVALLVALTRLAARHGGVVRAVGVVVAVLVGLFLNISYELYYVAVPLVLASVAQQPLLEAAADPGRGAERRARLWVGGAFLASFLGVFVAIRVWIADLCSERNCYEGSELDLGPQTVVTATRNLLTSVPGGARSEVRADLDRQGLADLFPGWVTPGSVLVGIVVAVALVVVVRAMAPASRGMERAGDEARARTEVRLLLLAALVPAAAALGTALVMALSSQAHDIVDSVGSPYRNTMVTWTMLALTAGMVVAALQLARPRSHLPAVGAAVAVAVLASHTVALNYPLLRAARVAPANQAVAAVHWEVVLGDPAEEADARRCDTLRELREAVGSSFSRERTAEGAEAAYRHVHGGPYCSEPSEE